MNQRIFQISLVVRDYDEALEYYVGVLGFELLENRTINEHKRWVVVTPPGGSGPALLLAKAANEEQSAAVGNQTGGRVFLFLHTDDFDRDYARYKERGVNFTEQPRDEEFGKVVVFRDLYGNKWDLVEPRP